MVSIVQDETSDLFAIAVVVGWNTSFHRNNTGALVGAHTAGDTTITFDGFAVDATILRRHTIELDGNTYTVKADGSSNGSGVVTDLELTSALLTSPADNTALTVSKGRTFYWSEREFSTAAGDKLPSQVFTPLMTISANLNSTLAAGDSFGAGFELDTVTLSVVGRELVGGEKYLERLEPYEFSGRAAQVYIVGKRGTEVLGWDDRETLMDGLVDQEPQWTINELRIPVRPKGEGLTCRWLEKYRGFGECPYWPNHITPSPKATIVVPADQWDPLGDSFSFLFWLWIPEGRGLGSASMINKNTVVVYENANKITAFVQTASGTSVVNSQSTELRLGTWFHVGVVCDRDADVLRMYIDGELTEEEAIIGGDITTTAAFDLGIGCVNSTTSDFHGMMAEIYLLEAPVTQSVVRQAVEGKLPDPATYPDMLAYWPGQMNDAETELFDEGPDFDPVATPTSPWNGTVSSSVIRGHTFEGGSELRGKVIKNGFGLIRNSTPDPIDPSRFIFRYANGPAQEPTAVYSNGAERTLEDDKLLYDFFNTAPAAGQNVTFCSRYGLMRLGAMIDGEKLTVDYGGRSASEGGLRLRAASSQHRVFTTAHTAFNASFSICFWLSMYDEETAGQTVMSCMSGSAGWDFILDVSVDNDRRYALRVYAQDTNLYEVHSTQRAGRLGEPHHFAIVCDEQGGGDLVISLYQDGILSKSATASSTTLAHPSSAFVVGNNLSINEPADCLISEISIHDAAIDVDTIREIMVRRSMLEDITSGPTAPTYAADLAHYYGFNSRDTAVANGTLADQFGSKDDDSGTAGTWVGGNSIHSTLPAIIDMLRFKGVSFAEIDYDDAFNSEPPARAVISLEVPTQGVIGDEATAAEIIDVLKNGVGLQVVFAAARGVWVIFRTENPDDLTAVETVEVADMNGPLDSGSVEKPPRLVETRWGLNPTKQDTEDLASSADDDHRQFVSKTERWAQETDGANAELLPTHEISIQVLGVFRYGEDAVAASVRNMDLRGRKIPLPRYFSIPLVRSRIDDTDVIPGRAMVVNHEDIPGDSDSRQVLIVKIETDGKTAKAKCWG